MNGILPSRNVFELYTWVSIPSPTQLCSVLLPLQFGKCECVFQTFMLKIAHDLLYPEALVSILFDRSALQSR